MKPEYVSGSLAMSHAMMMSTCRPDMHAGQTAIFGTRHPVGCMMATGGLNGQMARSSSWAKIATDSIHASAPGQLGQAYAELSTPLTSTTTKVKVQTRTEHD